MDASLFDFLAVAPLLVRRNELAELRAVVAEVVDADRLVAEEIEDAVECAAQYRRGEMPDMEGLCDIDGGIIDADDPARAHVRAAVLLPLRADAREDVFCKPRLVDPEVEIAIDGAHLADDVVADKVRFERVCDHDGALAHELCEFEAGQRVVTHRGIGRDSDGGGDLLRAHAVDLKFLCDICFVVHNFVRFSFLHILP